MASACVNNVGVPPENFLDCPGSYPSYGWLSPRISFSGETAAADQESTKIAKLPLPAITPAVPDPEPSGNDFGGFEFRLEDPATMLPADELFSDGKLVPLHLNVIRPAVTSAWGISSPDTPKCRRRTDISGMDPYSFSPKAPRCSSRWKELLGLKKLYQNSNAKQDNHKTTSSMSSAAPSHNNTTTSNAKSIKHFLHRSSKSIDASLNLPLLKDSDNESISISSRLSLSSSSSGHDHDDLPRLSLDSEKPNPTQKHSNPSCNPPRIKLVKSKPDNHRVGRSPMRRPTETTTTVRGVSVHSPRMNSSGKIVFQSLERSSSSPSSFNGGPRFKHRGMERSYSANVRVTPVLNVPVYSLRGSSKSGVFGFPLFSVPQKRDGGGGNGGNKSQHSRREKTVLTDRA